MSGVTVRVDGPLEAAINRFKRLCEGILSEVRRRQFYEKPSVKRRRKLRESLRRGKKAGNAARRRS